LKIIANHAHLMPKNSWREGNAEMLLKHLDHNGIDKVLVFPPFACQKDNNMKEANIWALKQVKAHSDRFLPAGTLFPLAPDALEMLNFLADEGVRLIKIHPAIEVHDISDPKIAPFYAEAERLGMVLDYHTAPHGIRLSLVTPQKFDDIAWDFPNLKMIFEHIGGRTYFEEFLAVIYNHHCRCRDEEKERCIFGGLTSVLNNSTMEHAMWYLGAQGVTDVIKIAGAGSLIFGLDFPWNDKERTQQDIKLINSLAIPEEDKAKILGGNLAKLLGINID
jgi:uncharacterized protein